MDDLHEMIASQIPSSTPLSRPARILVSDTWGIPATDYLKREFPHVRFRHLDYQSPGSKTDHPHGHMVAECVCRMLPPGQEVDLWFYGYLSERDRRDNSWQEPILQVDPDVVVHSWGIWHGNNPVWRSQLEQTYTDPRYLDEVERLMHGRAMFFAAGNDDSSYGTPDLDEDVAYPQKTLAAIRGVWVAGACDPEGVPTPWSADGRQVSAMYLGAEVRVWDPFKKRHVRVQGTSFAAPFMAGDYAAGLILGDPGEDSPIDWFTQQLTEDTTLAAGWPRGTHHPKAGWGCRLHAMKRRLESYEKSPSILSVVDKRKELPLAYHDLKKLSLRKTS